MEGVSCHVTLYHVIMSRQLLLLSLLIAVVVVIFIVICVFIVSRVLH